MTPRAILLGFVGVLFVCSYAYFNDAVMHQTMFVGNSMPISVYGGLVLFVLVLNPLLARLGRRLAFSERELTVVLVMTLSSCCIPGSGLMRTFTSTLLLPHHYARTNPGWQSQHVLEMVPAPMLTDVSAGEDAVVNGFVQGAATAGGTFAFWQVPWTSWARCLLFWLPLILSFWVALIGLSLVVHRQWAEHERLPYPIAEFAHALLPRDQGARSDLFKDLLFWAGVLPVMLIHLNNYAVQCLPAKLIEFRTTLDFSSLARYLETLSQGGAWFLFRPRIYFTAVAFAYFLATDVSLSLGLGPIAYAFVVGKLRQLGISVEGGGLYAPRISTFLGFGAFVGMLLSILYTGRQHFTAVVRHAFLGKGKGGDTPGRDAVWGARLFAGCFALFVLQLGLIGLDWQVATLYGAGAVIVFLIMSRILAETGLFFIQAFWFPCAVLYGIMGAQALGPTALLIMFMLTTVLALDTREALMPYFVNSLRLLDLSRLDRGRSTGLCVLAVVAGLAVAVPLVLYLQYKLGVDMVDQWANNAVPRFPFDETVAIKQRLTAQGVLAVAGTHTGWSRFASVSPDGTALASAGVGLVLVLAFSAARLRFPSWPLHPLLFLIWHTYPGKCFAVSFLIGWLIKEVVTRYGGAATYQRLKPLMFGLIAGEMLGGMVPIVFGALYHFITGSLPVRFSIMPG